MIERRIVRRYATALYQAASRENVVDRVESDLGLISYAIETSPDLLESLTSPLIPSDAKKNVVQHIFADKVADITLRYLYMLIDKRREDALQLTEEEYLRIANEARGIVCARVTSAVRLTEEEEAAIKSRLAKMTGKTVTLDKRVDPSLIGGVTVRIGDTVIDGSIKGQLASLREKMLS